MLVRVVFERSCSMRGDERRSLALVIGMEEGRGYCACCVSRSSSCSLAVKNPGLGDEVD